MSQVCESWEGDYKIASKSRPGLVHEVSLTGPDGVTTCTCEAYQFGRDPCRHIRLVMERECLWTEDEGPEPLDGDLIPLVCPRCGNDVISRGPKFVQKVPF